MEDEEGGPKVKVSVSVRGDGGNDLGVVLTVLWDWVEDSSSGGFLKVLEGPKGGYLKIIVFFLPERLRRIQGMMLGIALCGLREIELGYVDDAFFTPLSLPPVA